MLELKKLGKKGVLGMDTVKAVLVSLLVLAVIAIAVYLAISTLANAGIFTTGSQEYNATQEISGNITKGGSNFFKQVPTFFTLLAVVVLILIIAIVIVAVTRFTPGQAESL